MIKKPYPALCRDCAHSQPEEGSPWNLKCVNPKVNSNDPWALASAKEFGGTECRSERTKTVLWAPCGKQGKLWSPKIVHGGNE